MCLRNKYASQYYTLCQLKELMGPRNDHKCIALESEKSKFSFGLCHLLAIHVNTI